MDVNSKEAELWSETMRLKSLVEHKAARIARLEAVLQTQGAEIDRLCEALRAALAGTEET